MKGGVNGTEERVLSLRTEQIHCEIHCLPWSVKLDASRLEDIPCRSGTDFDSFCSPTCHYDKVRLRGRC